MENIDMEAIARKFGIWDERIETHPKVNVGLGIDIIPIKTFKNTTPNFREPEWLVRLMNELSERGYVWKFGRIGSVVVCFIKHHIRQEERNAEQANNWIDAFLLAAGKLAGEER